MLFGAEKLLLLNFFHIREKIQENIKTLKELEALHMKYMKKQEVFDLPVSHSLLRLFQLLVD